MAPMRLLSIVLVLLALPAPAAAQDRVPKNPSVTMSECQTSVNQMDRAATFVGRMRIRGGQQKLQMRFSLHTRPASDARWERVQAEGWDQWVSAEPGVRAYTYEKRVENLAAPAQYRALVRFRWRNAAGKTVKTIRLESPICRQPDMRPNLRPLRLDVLPSAEAGMSTYSIPVRNLGRSDSGPFTLLLTIDGLQEPGVPVASLAPGERRIVEVTARRCTPGAGGLSVRVDGSAQVSERNEADNSVTRACQ